VSAYRNKYLDMLKAEKSEKCPEHEVPKPTKPSFGSFGTSQPGAFSRISPPMDAEGVPCGGCPSCARGEFWRWPRFHKDHDRNRWVCWFCSKPPHGSGPVDFCGVPDSMLGKANGAGAAPLRSSCPENQSRRPKALSVLFGAPQSSINELLFEPITESK
jgi:hypothetical protein